MRLDTRIFPDIEALSRGALEEVAANIRDAISQRGRFAIALSGGHTPAKMYSLWSAPGKYRDETPWDHDARKGGGGL
jgi:6-phosphogluconolactonase